MTTLAVIPARAEATNITRVEPARDFKPFIEKSLSAETRRAYGRVIKEFFRFCGYVSPKEITPEIIIRWRDSLIADKKADSTIAFKLSVIRSLFEGDG